MKHRWTRNLGLKLMALFFAALLWLVVVNIDDPVDTQIYRNIAVGIRNTEVVTNRGKTYQVVGDEQSVGVTVTVSARRSILAKISSDNIVATADMREMEFSALVPISVTVQGYEGRYQSASATPHNLEVKIEDTKGDTFPLAVTATGTPMDGYELGEMKTNPESIIVKGAESTVSSIAKAIARVDVSGINKDSTLDAELLLYDGEGNAIDQSLLNINLDESGVKVDVQVLSTKDLQLNFAVSGTPAEGFVYTGVSSEPASVKVAGTSEALAQTQSIDIPASELNIEGMTGKNEMVVDISKYLPENVKLVDETANNVVVTVYVEQNGKKTIELPVESIEVKNLSEKFKITYETMEDIVFQFEGPQDFLETLNIKSAASIDLKSYTTAGTYEVPIILQIDEETGIREVQNPTVKITLTEKKQNEN